MLQEHKDSLRNINTRIFLCIAQNNYIFNVRINLISDDSEYSGKIMIFEDVTEEDDMREWANLSSLGMLAAGVLHEINIPLSINENYAVIFSQK